MLLGDRDGDLGALRGRSWDAVVDTSAYLPQQAAASAAALKRTVGHYCLVSTASVYVSSSANGVPEETPTHQPPDAPAELTPDSYGPLKVGCERAVQSGFGDAALVLRPSVLVGPYDPTGRFTYWVARVAEGGEVLAPGDPSHSVQVLDARDFAAWLMVMVEQQATGI